MYECMNVRTPMHAEIHTQTHRYRHTHTPCMALATQSVLLLR